MEFIKNLSENQNAKIGLCAGVSLVGAFFNFMAVCVMQSTVESGLAFNPYGETWFLMSYYFMVCSAVLAAVWTQTVPQYRLALVGAIAVALAYVPSDMHQAVVLATSNNSKVSEVANALASLGGSTGSTVSDKLSKQAAGGGLAIFGLLFFVVPMFLLLVFIGAEQDSFIHKSRNASNDTLASTKETAPVVVSIESQMPATPAN